MLDRRDNQSRAIVVKLVHEILDRNSTPRSAALGGQLTEMGLSSIDLVNLMLAVEAEFNLTLPQSELTFENFRSISTIIGMLGRLTQDMPSSS
jgi:acyl carrier protein